MPDADRIVLLVRTSLLTLNDALQSGNFSVLRDRAAPSFQTANTPARLSQIFADLLGRGLDLSSVAVMVPQLTATPVVDAQNRLRITGVFPGQPVGIAFNLIYEPVAGQWRLFGISVNPVTTTAPVGQVPPAPPAKSADDASKKAALGTPSAAKPKQ